MPSVLPLLLLPLIPFVRPGPNREGRGAFLSGRRSRGLRLRVRQFHYDEHQCSLGESVVCVPDKKKSAVGPRNVFVGALGVAVYPRKGTVT